jgi:tripartite ATP-independent transporter DctM subunit
MGALLYPALRQAGYGERYSLGLITSAGSLGLLFAPSLPLILYGFVAGQLGTQPPVTMEALFLAGILPGLMMVLLLAIHAVWVSPPRVRAPSWEGAELGAALKDAAWELPLPFVVLGGIYSGLLAASEAAAVTALYVLIVSTVIKKEISWRRLPEVMAGSMRLIGAILLILGCALAMSNWLVDQEVPTRLFEIIQSRVDQRWLFLLLLNLFLLVVGMLLDVFSALVILVPLLVPVALGYGVDPVHLGIIMLANLQLGYFTPPVGMNLFIAAYQFGTPVVKLVRATLPFLLILGLAVLLITWWPALSLVLVR